jgi:beta-lactam-binding protein with PASTA domain
VNTSTGALSAIRRLSIVIAIAIVFVFGLASTIFLSLRSPEVKVPDVLGKNRLEAERVLGDAGLNFRVRATRPSNEMQADTVLFQVPKSGEVVKAGQTVAMDISRAAKAGESNEAVVAEKSEEKPANQNTNDNANENENKPRKNKNTNKNANENENANTGNRNANANANRAAANKNANTSGNANTAGNANKATNLNANRAPANGNNNANRSVNQNAPVRPATAKPSPTVKPKPANP